MTVKLEFAVEFYYFYRLNMRDKSLIRHDKELRIRMEGEALKGATRRHVPHFILHMYSARGRCWRCGKNNVPLKYLCACVCAGWLISVRFVILSARCEIEVDNTEIVK